MKLYETLKSLGFEYIPQEGSNAWMRRYAGFILYIVEVPRNKKLLASITVGKLEISLPAIPDEQWIKKFHKENMLISFDCNPN